MLKVIDQNEIAKRKPYTYTRQVWEKIAKDRKQRKLKKDQMAKNITKINMLTEFINDDAQENLEPITKKIGIKLVKI